MLHVELSLQAEEAIRRSDRSLLLAAIKGAERAVEQLPNEHGAALRASVAFWRGYEHYLAAKFHDALRHLEQASALLEASEQLVLQARAITCMGACHQFMGSFDAAAAYMRQALAMHERANNKRGIATNTGNLGNLLVVAGQYEEALQCFTSALSVHQEIEDRDGVARTLGNIGNLYKETENYTEAMRYYEEALALYHELEDPAGIGRVVGSIGGTYLALGKYPESLEAYQKALTQFEELGDRRRIARTTTNIGIIYKQLHDYHTCQQLFAEALDMFEKIADQEAIAHVSGNIGECYLEQNEYDEAYTWLTRAIEQTRRVGNRRDESHFVANVIEVCLKLGRIDEARTLLEENEHLTTDIPTIRVSFLQWHAALAALDGNKYHQHELLEQALEIADRYLLSAKQMDLHRALRDLYRERGDLQAYIRHDDHYEKLLIAMQGEMQQRRLAVAMVERKISQERRESERQRALLHNTLPAHIAERLLKDESTVADLHENVGILFLDIVAFTSVASDMEPRHLVDLLNGVFSICDDIAQQYALTKIKTIGDAYLAVSGLSDASQHHVSSLAHAAVDIQRRLQRQDLVVRIGLHCGPVIAGVIGKERLQYDIWGDAVNVAARMEQTCEPGRIQCSEAMAEQLLHADAGSALNVQLRGEMEIKGKGRMRTYWLEMA
ncbi:MAG: tetratricopeptide repeat protein [Bacteroidetes bacterium]|nr:tetratricopeptide repeat protein [Bacteroidota bacterium]